MKFVSVAFGLSALLLSTAATAASPANMGRQIVLQGNGHGAAACNSCHGAALQGQPAIKAPAIAGLAASYILMRLDHYASPAGHNPLMKQEALALTPAERQAVAAYVAGLRKGEIAR